MSAFVYAHARLRGCLLGCKGDRELSKANERKRRGWKGTTAEQITTIHSPQMFGKLCPPPPPCEYLTTHASPFPFRSYQPSSYASSSFVHEQLLYCCESSEMGLESKQSLRWNFPRSYRTGEVGRADAAVTRSYGNLNPRPILVSTSRVRSRFGLLVDLYDSIPPGIQYLPFHPSDPLKISWILWNFSRCNLISRLSFYDSEFIARGNEVRR